MAFRFCLLYLICSQYYIIAEPLPFRNTSLPWSARVDDLVGRLSVEEAISQTMAVYQNMTPGIKRLGIKPFQWITECLSGQRGTFNTAWPQAIGLSSTFSTETVYNVASLISKEVRGHYNCYKDHSSSYGLNCFSPVINIMRHPLWGRNQETYGEDPFLSGQLGTAFIKGLMGNDSRYFRTSGTCKHLDAYGGPENIPISRFKFNAKVSQRDLHTTFLPQFRKCIEAGAQSLMCSYNSINGVPSCVNHKLLTEISRNTFGFKGFVISDAGAIKNVITYHKYLNTSLDTAVAAIKSSCNMELAGDVFKWQSVAFAKGLLTLNDIKENVKPLFYARMRLGEFDPPEMNPYTELGCSEIQKESHRDYAVVAAMNSMVLLKNQDSTLPLLDKYRKIAVVGPFADNVSELYGDYSPNFSTKYSSTAFSELRKLADTASLASGCADAKCEVYDRKSVIKAVEASDVVFICLGTGNSYERESHDRTSIDLLGHQLSLLKDASLSNPSAKVVVLVFTAGPLDISWAKESRNVDAILSCFYPAQSTGVALKLLLTAGADTQEDSVPSGRLSSTWPAYTTQVPPITDYNMSGHTYRYYKGEPLYPFGYGLSYSQIYYNDINIQSVIRVGQNLTVSITLFNYGPYTVYEVIQVYLKWLNPPVPCPKLSLVTFSREKVENKNWLIKEFNITSSQMALWTNEVEGFVVHPGKMRIFAGGQQPLMKTQSSSNILQQDFQIV